MPNTKSALIDIPVGQLVPNEWNPNEMTADVRKKLKRYLKKEGFVEPIVVRKKGKKYEIIDGFHRWELAQELGRKTVPAVVVAVNDRRAKIMTINLNEMRGEAEPRKLSEVLHDLSRSLDIGQLALELPFKVPEIKDSLSLMRLPIDLEDIDRQARNHDAKQPRILQFAVKPKDVDAVEGAITAIQESLGSNLSRGDALSGICRKYLKGR